MKNLPIFQLVVDEEQVGLYSISLVKHPADAVAFQAFRSDEDDEVKVNFSVDETEHRLLGVVARPDFLVIRRDDKGNHYYVTFKKEEIQKMVRLFLKNGFNNLVNVEHRPDSFIEGVELEQVFTKDVARGINPVGFEHVEDGSLFFQYKVLNDAVWQAVQEGTFTGFSIEGIFKIVPDAEEVTSLEQLLQIIKNG